jgi:hypothetical protein
MGVVVSVMEVSLLIGLPRVGLLRTRLLSVGGAGEGCVRLVRLVLDAVPAGPLLGGTVGFGGRVGVANAAGVLSRRCVPVR